MFRFKFWPDFACAQLQVVQTPIPKGAELAFSRGSLFLFSRVSDSSKSSQKRAPLPAPTTPRSPSTMTANLLPSQIGYIEYMRQGKTAALTDGARQNDHASHAELNKLRALPCNSTCFDCTALKPGWACFRMACSYASTARRRTATWVDM